ncbi:MAG: START domain-containing protein [Holophaga sp.]|nr:START domain-containing protein [Holophaga sp.]
MRFFVHYTDSMFKAIGSALFVAMVAHASPSEWRFLYEKEGFRAYERKGPPLAYKAEGIVNLPLAEVAAVLIDIPRQKEWVHRLVESRILEGNPLSRSVIYSRYNLPWPATDRDAVVESVVAEDIKRAEVLVRFQNTTALSAPVRRDCIRVPLSEGVFTLRDTGQDTVMVSYSVSLDPGGWLPDWIVRLFVRDAPVSTLQAFKAQVLKTRGQYDTFIAAQKARWASDQR